ncbi:MAG: 2-oxo acid dehydrogenase subunit E2, partial [Methanobrevibacter sp.]|nr:2-oxo acid dehydrogenase subunit E2 [Methanobrevibacter sp.]
FSDEGEESTTVSTFERDSNIEDIRKILTKEIKGVKESSDDEAGDFIGVLMKLPKFIISSFIWVLDFFIVIGYMPKSLRGVDVMQASAFVANLGSIGLKGAPYHHLFDRGTCSLFVTLGRVRKDFVITEDGIVEKYLVDVKLTIDERISDGFYYVRSLDLLEDILKNPEQLDERLKEVPIDE